MGTVSVFTLKRTDTTLDLSQKAKRAGEERKEKVGEVGEGGYLYSSRGIFGRQFWPLANRSWVLGGQPLCTNNRSTTPCLQELHLYIYDTSRTAQHARDTISRDIWLLRDSYYINIILLSPKPSAESNCHVTTRCSALWTDCWFWRASMSSVDLSQYYTNNFIPHGRHTAAPCTVSLKLLRHSVRIEMCSTNLFEQSW